MSASASEPGTGAASFEAVAGDVTGTWVLHAGGEIDVATAPQLRRELHQLVDRGASTIVVDLADVSFVDSSGLGVLVGMLKRVREDGRGGELILEHLQESVRKVFDITGLDQIFTIR
jgi:anti-sigma B factor antagonist